jgi:hypothetical protein
MDIEETRNAYLRAHDYVMTAPRCSICTFPSEPTLMNVTGMNDESPRWLLEWHCNNYDLHEYIRKQKNNG